MVELKPCPFCGGKAEFDEVQTSLRPVEWSHKVICPECYVILAETSLFKTKEEASEAWNTRASGWIPCSERMPFEPGVHVLVTDGQHIMESWYEVIDEEMLWVDNYTMYVNIKFGNVTHWMPLPDLPGGDRSE